VISSIRKRLVAQTGIEAITPSEAPCAGKSKATTRKPASTRTGKRKAKSSGCPSQPCTSSTAGPVPTSTAETFPRGPASQNLLPFGSEIVELLGGRRAGVKNARAARAAGRGSADLIWFPPWIERPDGSRTAGIEHGRKRSARAESFCARANSARSAVHRQ